LGRDGKACHIVRKLKEVVMSIDATYARKAKAAVVMDTGHIVLAAISAETIVRRLDATRGEDSFKSEGNEE
jgi:regulator of extracellular matrix RemA (YlzA/DUF370 family)